MTRAALVACAIAAAAATPLSAARAASDRGASGSTIVVRGVVVQYIPPSGSIIGSLSLRVIGVGPVARALDGELVTIAVVPGSGSRAARLLAQGSLCTVTLYAPSPASILKGRAALQGVVPGKPASPGNSGSPGHGTGPVNPDAGTGTPNGGSPGGTSQGGDSGHSQGSKQGGSDPAPSGQGDHGSGQPGDHGSGPPARPGGGGASNGHK